jgi:hypothetical protein
MPAQACLQPALRGGPFLVPSLSFISTQEDIQMAHKRFVMLLSWAVLFSPLAARSDAIVELKNNFIDDFKNRATIDVTFSPKFAHPHAKKPSPNKPSNDGDIHISGTAPEIGLLTVAEIFNAADFLKTLKFVQEQLGSEVPMTGVWRIWPEHGGESHHVQGAADASKIINTNPPHVFEVHPLTKVGQFDVKTGFHSIPGFKTKDAESAFNAYEGARSTITPKGDMTQIRMSVVTYNYVEFRLELLEDPTHDIDDGLTLFGKVRDLSGETLVQERRAVFVKGTKPEVAVRKLKANQCMHVLGMPRLNLSLVSWRLACSKNDVDAPGHEGQKCSQVFPDVLQWGIPYEIVVLADYGGSRKCD